MKLLDTIQNNLRLYQGMTQAKVSYDFLKTQKEEDLLRLSEQINQMDASKIILMLQESAVAYLIKDPKFLPDLIRLECEEKISINSINSMLAHAGEDVLSVNFKYEELYEVLTDERIFNQWKYEYLKYYSKCGFDSRQLLDLMDGISKLSSYADFTLSELSNTERLLLIEPFFRSGLINEVISDRTVWKYFEEPEVKEILNICASSPIYDCRIHQEQIKEISRNAGSILKDIKSVLPYFPQKCQDGFIEQWLENDMLVYDLKQLKRNLPSATEDALVRMVKNRTFYLNFLYGDFLAELNLENVSSQKQDMLIYALTHRKKHFLSVVKEYFSLFLKLPRYSLLMDKEVYTTYLNLNTLNGKNLQEACGLGCLSKEIRKCLTRKDYTFAELKLFVTVGKQYVYLYHQLYPLKYDERMKTIRELAGKECIPDNISEESLISIAENLRQKPLSQWIHKELGHIENLSWNCAVKVLAVWNELERFIPGVQTEQHLLFLLKNQEKVNEYPDFESVIKQITEIDTTWNTLCRQLKIEPSFIHENQKGVREFLYQGGAEIISLFLRDSDEDAEKIRRLCMAEIAGRFYDVKYHKGDLEREISLKVPDEIEEIWKKNLSMKEGNAQLWEEDRLLPVMQIGELVGRTCLSYRNGRYKECLLSAFDANKKVLYFALNGQLVFRAFIRLTKGTLSNRKSQNNHLQFVDITKEEQESASKQIDQTEQLTLFLERPYFKGISEEKEREIVQFVLRMLKQKAKKMSAQLILSNDYKALVPETSGLVRAQYHMYISASKNGKQYLDSLGGMATINNEGSYEKGMFLLPVEFLRQNTL